MHGFVGVVYVVTPVVQSRFLVQILAETFKQLEMSPNAAAAAVTAAWLRRSPPSAGPAAMRTCKQAKGKGQGKKKSAMKARADRARVICLRWLRIPVQTMGKGFSGSDMVEVAPVSQRC
mmetsp:Transcript_7047/g.11998  ORF Transcript_7047/g.11998 Transcript_7047/m.11998 type:complete len:119 (+) Transcript_7047:1195-1551(+)